MSMVPETKVILLLAQKEKYGNSFFTPDGESPRSSTPRILRKRWVCKCELARARMEYFSRKRDSEQPSPCVLSDVNRRAWCFYTARPLFIL